MSPASRAGLIRGISTTCGFMSPVPASKWAVSVSHLTGLSKNIFLRGTEGELKALPQWLKPGRSAIT